VATVQPPPDVAPQPLVSPKIDEANENRLLLTYGQSISKEIKRHQNYPPWAQRQRWEGTAEVLLQVAADGKVTGVMLGKSSGHDILDKEALDMVRRASPLPQAPADLRGRARVVTVPIVFKLQS
jgi:protein TonB